MSNPFPWPPILPTVSAARYCSTSRWSLYRAYERGEIRPIGRRGRTFTWSTTDLDAWMTGATVNEPRGRGETLATTAGER